MRSKNQTSAEVMEENTRDRVLCRGYSTTSRVESARQKPRGNDLRKGNAPTGCQTNGGMSFMVGHRTCIKIRAGRKRGHREEKAQEGEKHDDLGVEEEKRGPLRPTRKKRGDSRRGWSQKEGVIPCFRGGREDFLENAGCGRGRASDFSATRKKDLDETSKTCQQEKNPIKENWNNSQQQRGY